METEEKVKEAAKEIGEVLAKYQKEGFSVFNLVTFEDYAISGFGGSKKAIVQAFIKAIEKDKNFREIWEIVIATLHSKAIEKKPSITIYPDTTIN